MSSNSPPNYTEGVPIKISEKYKPPPEIHLPTRVLQQFAKVNVPVAFDHDYDFSLERKIISKTSEWINIRVRERRERQERIQQRELARQRQIELEQKLKLNQVSYPSADEISSCDEDDEVANGTSQPQIKIEASDKPFSPTNFNTILVPTQASQPADTLGFKKSHRRYASNSSNKIDFSFFESDTSPFDHLEMKSMNEMEMLAEVLGSTTMSSNQTTTESNNIDNTSEIDQKSNGNNGNIAEQQTTCINHQASSMPQSIPQQTYVSQVGSVGGFYAGSNYIAGYGMSPITAHHLSNHFNYPQNSLQHQHQPQQHFTYPQNSAVNNQFNSFNSMMTNNNNNTIVNNETSGKSDEFNKRRNIPSIIQELNDELNNSERRRIRNHSQSLQKESTLPEGRFLVFFVTLT